jgi:hypothetical protein
MKADSAVDSALNGRSGRGRKKFVVLNASRDALESIVGLNANNLREATDVHIPGLRYLARERQHNFHRSAGCEIGGNREI